MCSWQCCGDGSPMKRHRLKKTFDSYQKTQLKKNLLNAWSRLNPCIQIARTLLKIKNKCSCKTGQSILLVNLSGELGLFTNDLGQKFPTRATGKTRGVNAAIRIVTSATFLVPFFLLDSPPAYILSWVESCCSGR